LATTDLVNARGLLDGGPKSLELIATSADDKPLSVQVFGADQRALCDAAVFLESRGADVVDINMGCPVRKVTKTGSGAGMLCRRDDAARLVESVVRAVRIPVTVKMRLGWDERQITAPEFARLFEEAGVAAVAIHGRTRAQGFSGRVNLAGIAAVVQAVRRIPVIGNGDVRSAADAWRMLRETGCHGVSIGRGALANPWIFAQLSRWERGVAVSPAGTFDDRLALLRKQFAYVVEWRGEARAIPFFRKMAHWHLKAMGVSAPVRNAFQQVSTRDQFERALQEIERIGPGLADRRALRAMHIPVPSGPVERW
jgi:nifR3 family TIM-barrel protein